MMTEQTRRREAEVIGTLLRSIRGRVPAPAMLLRRGEKPRSVHGRNHDAFDHFDGYLAEGDLPLAWDAVAKVAKRTLPEDAVWDDLAAAAARIGRHLPEDAHFLVLVAEAGRKSPELRTALRALPLFATDAADASAISAFLSHVGVWGAACFPRPGNGEDDRNA